MKKKFIFLLCRIGLYKWAYKLSPSLAFLYRFKIETARIDAALNETSHNCKRAGEAIKQLANEINKNKAMKVKLDDGAFMPTRAHDTDAGLDLYATETQIVPAKESAKFDTGVHVELPRGTVGMLKSKSGLNVNHGITSEGVIDVGYTGSIVVKLYNNSGYDYMVNRGDKISQLVIMPMLTPELEVVDTLEETERGAGGFGSTGK